MTVIEMPTTRICYSTTSSSGAFRGPVFDHDSATARLYLALYPAGDAQEAAVTAGLTEDIGQQELRRLQDLHLVERQGDAWRCTMPVVDETDLELVRLWSEPIAAVVAAHLESLHASAVALVDGMQGAAAGTVLAVAMAEAARRPFAPLQAQLGASAPDRGATGPFSAALFTVEIPDAVVLRGAHRYSHCEGEGWSLHAYYQHPAGVSRPGVAAIVEAFDLRPAEEARARDRLAAMLYRGAHDGITPEWRGEFAQALGIESSRRDAFWRALVDLGALSGGAGDARLLVPTVPLADWEGYLDRLDRVGEEVAGRVVDAADGLRRRAARCSFADCCFADAVLVFTTCAAALVGRAIDEKRWITIPAEADLSWGVLLAV